jgi:hypothetical protein
MRPPSAPARSGGSRCFGRTFEGGWGRFLPRRARGSLPTVSLSTVLYTRHSLGVSKWLDTRRNVVTQSGSCFRYRRTEWYSQDPISRAAAQASSEPRGYDGLLKESLERLWTCTYEGAHMIVDHIEGILDYCRSKVCFGVVEASNGSIKSLMRRGRGYKNRATCSPRPRGWPPPRSTFVAFKKAA